jgi:hypothetical protein
VSAEVLAKAKPNEAGAVMVIMYHRFRAEEKDSDLNRHPDTFRKDLDTLYAKNYYPVNALDFVQNTMDGPAGKTPVVLTFDDALPTQFNVINRNGKDAIDPDCAVGIMETFSKKHSDWPMRATFFVLPKEGKNAEPFGQAESVEAKLKYLADKGYEIANHTTTHSSMRTMDAQKIQWELATAHEDIIAMEPRAAMKTMALPFGKIPRKKKVAERKALMSGQNGGTTYEHAAVFTAAYRPNLSPLTKQDNKLTEGGQFSTFDPGELERVTPDARKPGTPGTLEYWIKFFDANPTLRYVSDGDQQVAAIPASKKGMVDEERAKAQGKVLQFYGGGPGGKGGGGDLSVG